MNEATFIDVKEAAARLGVSYRRAVQLIESGKLPAQRFSRVFLVNPDDLALVADRKPGRPPKPKSDDEPATGAAEATITAATDTTEAKPKRTRKAKAAKPKRAGKKAKAE